MSPEAYPLPFYKLFYPPDQAGQSNQPALPGQADHVVIMPNSLGMAVCREDGSPGAAGRKAQAVADRTGYAVLAYDRLGTGNSLPPTKVTPQTDYDAARWTGGALFRRVRAEGFSSVILAGNAAGATAVASLACSDVLPVSHVCVMDPLGIEGGSTSANLLKWLAHSLRECRLGLPEEPARKGAAQSPGSSFSLQSFARDRRAYSAVWASEQAASNLRTLAAHYGSVVLRACWPDQPGFTSQAAVHRLSQAITTLRTGSGNTSAQPASISIDDPIHSQYEHSRAFATSVARAMQADFPGFNS